LAAVRPPRHPAIAEVSLRRIHAKAVPAKHGYVYRNTNPNNPTVKKLIASVKHLTELVASSSLLVKQLTDLVRQSRKLAFALCLLVCCLKCFWATIFR
jgi:hypothetical protein